MIIYRDLISHDKMFSNIYKIREIVDGLCLEVEGKMVSRTDGNTDDSLIGGNASAEGPEGEGTESTVITGVDIVMNHHLQETSFAKEAYKKYLKDYMKSIKGKLEEQRPERVKPFIMEEVSPNYGPRAACSPLKPFIRPHTALQEGAPLSLVISERSTVCGGPPTV
nr:translationally-controlled tumor protein-like [Saimiri boliviensis boliviensis]